MRANEFIKSINAAYGTTAPLVDLTTFSRSAPVRSGSVVNVAPGVYQEVADAVISAASRSEW